MYLRRIMWRSRHVILTHPVYVHIGLDPIPNYDPEELAISRGIVIVLMVRR